MNELKTIAQLIDAIGEYANNVDPSIVAFTSHVNALAESLRDVTREADKAAEAIGRLRKQSRLSRLLRVGLRT